MHPWYEVSGLDALGYPFVYTPCDEMWHAQDLVRLLTVEEGCTDVVIVIRRN